MSFIQYVPAPAPLPPTVSPPSRRASVKTWRPKFRRETFLWFLARTAPAVHALAEERSEKTVAGLRRV